MEIYSPKLFIEINKSNYIFAIGDENKNKNFYLIYKKIVPKQDLSFSFKWEKGSEELEIPVSESGWSCLRVLCA